MGAKIYTIPPSQAFLQSVARGVLDQVADDPLKLSDYTILVPNREIGFLLRQAFMEQTGGLPGIMPRIDTPGDMDDEHLSLKISDNRILSQALMDIPPAVSHLERQLVLAQQILKIPGMASSVQKAIKLGGELGLFLDDLQRHDIDLQKIGKLVPHEFKEQWAKTAGFLAILTETWPQHLQKRGLIDPEDHKNAVVEIQAAHWGQNPPSNPVMAVGFTETSPAILSLMQSVARMPQGAIILPGVDLNLDKDSWIAVSEVHPQYSLKKILSSLVVDRADVQVWPASVAAAEDTAQKRNLAREALLRETMRPSVTAEEWVELKRPGKEAKAGAKKPVAKAAAAPVPKKKKTVGASALIGMDLVTCGTPQEEASVIALKMREALETPGRTVHLVTEDRLLARRVSARLRYWGIHLEDGAGTSLAETPAGIFLLATANMAAEEWAPVPVLEALKHPLAALGEKKDDFRSKLSRLEDTVFHGARPPSGAAGVKGSLTAAFNRAARNPSSKLTKEQKALQQQEMEAWLDKLYAAGKSFFDKTAGNTPVPFKDLLDEHIRFAEKLAESDAQKGPARLWVGDDGVKATRFLTELREKAHLIPPVTGRDYVDVLQGLMRDVNVRSTASPHPSLKIMTPEQARLSKADVVILGGLNDEVWPARAEENPWLSPDMLKALGLPPAETGIGRSAHKFVERMSSRNVLISRAVRDGSAPTVASPFLMRLTMVLKGAGLGDRIEHKTQLLDIHAAMHTPMEITPVEPPAPAPPSARRPKQLPVTAVEKLMRDPYSVYARYVLNLRPKAPIDASPTASERGIFIHDALDAFTKKYPDKMPPNACEELLTIGEETFRSRLHHPAVQAFWWPRFERIAKWFVKFEEERRETSRTVGTEVSGKLEIDLGGEIFTLTTKADRIDLGGDGLSVIDYKTGSVPSQKSVALGFSPQLTLEALIAFSGGFNGIAAGDVGELQYWKLSGGRPAAEVTEVRGDVRQLVDEAKQGVENLVRAFNDSKTPYLATPRPEWAPRYNNYRHLSREGEWGAVKKKAAAERKRAVKKERKENRNKAHPGAGKAKP